jgi:hypothetical protein
VWKEYLQHGDPGRYLAIVEQGLNLKVPLLMEKIRALGALIFLGRVFNLNFPLNLTPNKLECQPLKIGSCYSV